MCLRERFRSRAQGSCAWEHSRLLRAQYQKRQAKFLPVRLPLPPPPDDSDLAAPVGWQGMCAKRKTLLPCRRAARHVQGGKSSPCLARSAGGAEGSERTLGRRDLGRDSVPASCSLLSLGLGQRLTSERGAPEGTSVAEGWCVHCLEAR